LFFYFYTILSILIYLAALPFLLFFSLKSKYRQSLPARFFLWKNRPLKPDGIWFHSCSFGEAKALKPLVEALPPELLRMSSTTHTGFSVISDYTKESRYLPFEPLLFFWLRPQKVLLVMEAEFWYLLFLLVKRRGAKTLLVNARMSDRSFPKYQKTAWLYRQIFKYIDEVYAQTEEDKKRLESLGAAHVKVTGNIKLSVLPKPTERISRPPGMVVCGASMHEGEEKLVLNAYLALKNRGENVTLLLVPRHPERFQKVTEMVALFCTQYGFSMQRYSEKKTIESDIVVVDMLGELVNLYAISDIVVLGGAFEPAGGHNAAEAAQFGCKIITGKHYYNQRDIFAAVEGITVVESVDLTESLLEYRCLKPAAIRIRTDIAPIIKSIKKCL